MASLASTSTSVSRRSLTFSLLLLLSTLSTQAQGLLRIQQDSVPFFRGVAVSFDLVGATQMLISDYGQYEGALRINLRDRYFPIFEAGYGKADHHGDQVTGISYRTKAPYFRLGLDFNILKRKHTGNRLFVGFRYACTYYKIDLERKTFADPVWKWPTGYGVQGQTCNMHWLEVVFGLDAKVFGPLHLGWSARYKRRLFGNNGVTERTWYVPGFGIYGDSRLGATFNVTIDI